jgi:hypothetical protein
MNMLPPSSGLICKPSKDLAKKWQQENLLCLFNPEDGGGIFLQNVGCLSMDYTASSQKIEPFITKTVRTLNPISSLSLSINNVSIKNLSYSSWMML